MARDSRIRRPLGSLFLKIYASDVQKFGLAGAAVISELDFIDRAQEGNEFKPLATRARIIANLEGVVGKHAIDDALRHLASVGIVTRHEKTTMGEKNWIRSVTYGLDPRVSAGLSGFGTIGDSHSDNQNRDNPNLPEPEPKSGQDSGVTSNNKKEVKAEAAVDDKPPAAANRRDPEKQYDLRSSGIVTWYQSDLAKALKLEAEFSQEDITAAVKAVKKRKKEPVPGLVQQALEEINEARQTEKQRLAIAEDLRKKLSRDLPPEDPLKVEERKKQLAAQRASFQRGAHA